MKEYVINPFDLITCIYNEEREECPYCGRDSNNMVVKDNNYYACFECKKVFLTEKAYIKERDNK